MINIYDTLSVLLDMNSFELISSSHPVVLNYHNDTRRMIFSFSNILFPDSNTNEAGSHGFVRYRIKCHSNLMAGDVISSRAYIYFDLNDPVETNTAVTPIVDPTGIAEYVTNRVIVYPNPAEGVFYMAVNGGFNNGTKLLVTDVTGKIILEEIVENSMLPINCSRWKSGIYIIKITDQEKTFTGKLLKQ
jgi:hypothetical protein